MVTAATYCVNSVKRQEDQIENQEVTYIQICNTVFRVRQNDDWRAYMI